MEVLARINEIVRDWIKDVSRQKVNNTLPNMLGLLFKILKSTLRTYLWWSLCALYLHACQMRVSVGDSGSLLLYLCYIF